MQFRRLEASTHFFIRWRERIGDPVPSLVEVGEMIRDARKVRMKSRDLVNSDSIFAQLEDVIFVLKQNSPLCFAVVTVYTDAEPKEPIHRERGAAVGI